MRKSTVLLASVILATMIVPAAAGDPAPSVSFHWEMSSFPSNVNACALRAVETLHDMGYDEQLRILSNGTDNTGAGGLNGSFNAIITCAQRPGVVVIIVSEAATQDEHTASQVDKITKQFHLSKYDFFCYHPQRPGSPEAAQCEEMRQQLLRK
jgi:hypothetical protein